MKINIVVISMCILVIALIMMNSKSLEFFDGEELKETVPNVSRPFVNIYDDQGNKLNIMLVSKPFRDDSELKIYEDNKDKNIFLGITSYLEFPNIPSNPFEDFTDNYKKYKYLEICEGWIHGFREPEKYFPPDLPLLFASESDFIDCHLCKPIKGIEKKYDFIYVCLKVDEKKEQCDDWATYNKNWALAKKCLDVFCNKYKLKGLLIGRKGCELPNGCKYMETTNMLTYDDLKKKYNEARFIFLPNEKDASPRVLTEAMASDVPCLLNKNILGGWKYVNDRTGEFFTDENDIGKSVEILLDKIKRKHYKPREYFIKNYSVQNAGKKFKNFLYENWNDRINIPRHKVKYVTPEFSKKDFKTCKSVL
tara:strand:+ start:1566 stop:2660 length:1095 start_codon:yes stop_codon:yes gene_type:complete